MIPDYWKEFVTENSLTGKEVSIPEDADRSELGAELGFLDEEGIRSETEDVYPGIAVVKDGFLPVGSCLEGTGDPYFINVNDGPHGPLYRIYHDAVSDNGYDRNEAVAIVLEDFFDILKHI